MRASGGVSGAEASLKVFLDKYQTLRTESSCGSREWRFVFPSQKEEKDRRPPKSLTSTSLQRANKINGYTAKQIYLYLHDLVKESGCYYRTAIFDRRHGDTVGNEYVATLSGKLPYGGAEFWRFPGHCRQQHQIITPSCPHGACKDRPAMLPESVKYPPTGARLELFAAEPHIFEAVMAVSSQCADLQNDGAGKDGARAAGKT